MWALSPWLLEYACNGRIVERDGNRSDRAVLHGAYPCAGDDRWVAVAAWDDDELARLAKVAELDAEGNAEVEDALSAWTSTRTPLEVADLLQAAGLEAVPVQDFGECFDDPQLRHRDHFVTLTHPFLGEGAYERNGFRLSDAPSGYARPAPTLGQDNDHVLGEILGLSSTDIGRLATDGVLE